MAISNIFHSIFGSFTDSALLSTQLTIQIAKRTSSLNI